jgi:hypothetical protein
MAVAGHIVDGKTNTLDQMIYMLPSILSSSNTQTKVLWLNALLRFRARLQEKVVPLLLSTFETEGDHEVKKHILTALLYSRDPRAKLSYLEAVHGSDQKLQVLGAYFLVDSNDPEGIGTLIQLLDALDLESKKTALRDLWSISNRYHLGFEFKPDPKLNEDENIQQLVAAWKDWWAKNKSKYGAQ